MKTRTLLLAAATALTITAANATTVRDTFTCHGLLNSLSPGIYNIVADSPYDYDPMTCLLDDSNKASTKKILAVCHVGNYCIVRASGWRGNGNRYAIDKLLYVRPDHDMDNGGDH